jgi:hypothetical protein
MIGGDLRHRPPHDISTLETWGDEARERMRETAARNLYPRVQGPSVVGRIRDVAGRFVMRLRRRS